MENNKLNRVVNFVTTDKMHKELKRESYEKDISIAEIIRNAIEEHFNNNNKGELENGK